MRIKTIQRIKAMFLSAAMVASALGVQIPAKAADVITKTQYRYRTIESYETETTTIKTSPGTDYTFVEEQVSYGEWGSWSSYQETAVTESDTRQVRQTTLYRYYRYVNEARTIYSPYVYESKGCTIAETTGFIEALTIDPNKNYDYFPPYNECWYQYGRGYGGESNLAWFGERVGESFPADRMKTGYSYRDRTKTVSYVWEKPVWSEWSEWSTTPQTESSVKQVQTREVEYTDISTCLTNVPDLLYTGEIQKPNVGVVNGSVLLTEGVDYVLSGDTTARNVGTYSVTVSGIGDYAGSKTLVYDVYSADINDYEVSVSDVTYNGKYQTPTLQLLYHTTNTMIELEEGKDYEVLYSDNKNAGTASAAITGIGKFVGERTVYFPVLQKDVNSEDVTVNYEWVVEKQNGLSVLSVKTTVMDGDTLLTEGVDYSALDLEGNTLQITGKGNYTGKRKESLNKRSISSATVQVKNATYTGSALTPSVTVKDDTITLKQGTDYTVKYSNNINAGTGKVTISGIGNYSGTKTATFTISKKSITGATMTEVKARVYSGSAITPAFTVTLNGKKLVKNTDYTVTCTNNVNVGTATMQVTGKGNYTGSFKKTFKVVPKGTSVRGLTPEDKGFTVRWDKQATAMKTTRITGYQIQYSTSKTFASNKKVQTVTGYGKTTATIKGLTRNKMYYIRIRTYKKVNGVNYFAQWSSTKMIKTK